MNNTESTDKAFEYLNWYFTQDDGTADKNAVNAWEVLLREQEPVKPIMAREGRNKYWSYYVCPSCNDDLNYGQKYCSECGRKVKWE